MKPITLEEIDKKKKNIAQSLDQLNLEKKESGTSREGNV